MTNARRDGLLTRIAILLMSCFTIASGLGGTSRAAEWPQWLGAQRNGTSSEIVAPWSSEPQVLWRRPVGNGYSSPIIAGGIVYLHTRTTEQGREAEDVLALKANTGEPVWTATYDRPPYRSILGTGPRATPTASGDKLFTYGINGELSCFKAATGEVLWRKNPYTEFESSLPRFGVCSSPAATDSHVAVLVGGGGSAVASYDIASGKLAWKALDEPAGAATPTVLASEPGSTEPPVLVVQSTLRLLGMNSRDGSVLWEHPLVFEPTGVTPTPLRIGRSLICTTPDTGTLSLQLPDDGGTAPNLAWHKPDAGSYFSTGAAGPDGTVLVITNQQDPLPRADLRCFDIATGDELWRADGLGYYHFGPILLGDGKLLVLSDAGYLSLAEVTRKGYRELVKSKVCGGWLSNPALSDGRLVVRDDKELICLRLGAAPDAPAAVAPSGDASTTGAAAGDRSPLGD